MGVDILYTFIDNISISKHDVDEEHYQVDLQGGENSAYSSFIELTICEFIVDELFENDGRYKIARNDEEYLYTNQPCR